MQFNLNQFNVLKSLNVSSVIAMVLHLGYSTVVPSLVETICFLATVDDAKTVMNALDALEVRSVLKQVT